MPKSIIVEGKTSTEAIEKGLKELNVTKNQVDIKIIEEKKKSFFNILAPHIVQVELTLKEEVEEIQNKKNSNEVNKEDFNKAMEALKKFLNEFFSKISEKINYSIEKKDESIYITVKGEKSEKLIGYRGEALNALQEILSNIANKNNETRVKVILDIGQYKDARKKTLEELALKIAKTVKKTKKPVTLEPMTPYERKIIHSALQNNEDVKTYSIGENDKRRVVITIK